MLVNEKMAITGLVLNSRGLKKQIEKTSRPLPRVNDVIDSLERNCYFSDFDLTSKYFQMVLNEESHNMSCFCKSNDLYMWNKLLIGLVLAPGPFQTLMELIVAGFSYKVALV